MLDKWWFTKYRQGPLRHFLPRNKNPVHISQIIRVRNKLSEPEEMERAAA